MDISLVIPLFNEAESLPELYAWIIKVLEDELQIERFFGKKKLNFEIILIDDGSKDSSWQVIEKLAEKDFRVSGIRLQKNYGKSAALFLGFERAKGEIIFTLDADLQDSPEEFFAFIELIQQGNDMVSGWKKKRYDPLSKTLPTKLFNAVARFSSGIDLHDFNCGLKAYRKNVIKNIEVYGEMHRYLPILVKNAGFDKIVEKEVQHQARKYGESKFGWNRFINGFLDLFSILFLTRFGKKPMHLFGFLGTILFIFSTFLLSYLLIDKVFFHTSAKLLSQRTEFLLGLTGIILGSQFFLAGFLAELISRNSSERNVYRVTQIVN